LHASDLLLDMALGYTSANTATKIFNAKVWVPESRRTSRDLLILVDEAAASVASSDLVELGSTAVGEWA
jgi:hypothetical protein